MVCLQKLFQCQIQIMATKDEVSRLPSTLPLMERINAILGKREEFRCGNDTETDSDGSSNADGNESLPVMIGEESHCTKGSKKLVETRVRIDSCSNKDVTTAKRLTKDKDVILLSADDLKKDAYTMKDIDLPYVSTSTPRSNKVLDNFKNQQDVRFDLCQDGEYRSQDHLQSFPASDREVEMTSVMEKRQVEYVESAINTGADARKKAKEVTKKSKEAEKEQEKKRKLMEREEKKRKQEHEKNMKRVETMTAKANSMDQCLKHLTAILDTSILTDGGSAVLQALETAGVQFEVKKLPVDSTIGWVRNQVKYTVTEDGEIKRNDNYEEEDEVLIRIKAEHLAQMIDFDTRSEMEGSQNGVLSLVSNAESLLPGKRITIIFTGMEAYSKTAKAKSALKRKQASMPCIAKTNLEDTLLRLQLEFNYCVHFCEQAEDLAQFICAFTKSVAERPHKRVSGVAFDVYMSSFEKGLPRVTKDGQGLLDVWVRQLQQLKGIGYETAAAIAQKYPSPSFLFKEYQNVSSMQEASLLLQDIEVRRGHGVLATSRRVGPELSKKIHTLLTSMDGHIEVAKS